MPIRWSGLAEERGIGISGRSWERANRGPTGPEAGAVGVEGVAAMLTGIVPMQPVANMPASAIFYQKLGFSVGERQVCYRSREVTLQMVTKRAPPPTG